MQSSFRRVVVGALVMSLALAALPAGAGPTPLRRARQATRYLALNQEQNGSFTGFSPIGTTSDAVLAFVAAKRGPRQIERAVAYLRENLGQADNVGRVAKVVMAVEAAGRDPRRFAGRNLVRELRTSQQPDGQFGSQTPDDPYDAEVVNHALVMLALVAVGHSPSSSAGDWLAAAQCADGGWQYNDPSAEGDDEHCNNGTEFDATSDTNTTSYAVQALALAPATAALTASPFRFFRQARDPVKRGWGFDLNFRLTETNSTALVIQAYVAQDRRLPAGAMRALTRLQYRLCGRRSGAFSRGWTQEGDAYRRDVADVASTIAAIPAVLKKALPIASADVTRKPPRRRPC